MGLRHLDLNNCKSSPSSSAMEDVGMHRKDQTNQRHKAENEQAKQKAGNIHPHHH